MWTYTFDRGLAVFGIVLAIVLIVLDKAEKLKGPVLFILLGIAAAMTIPLVFSFPWISSQVGQSLFARRALGLFAVGLVYALLCVWIAPDSAVPTVRKDAPVEPLPQIPPTKTAQVSHPVMPAQGKLAWNFDSHKPETYFLGLCKCGGRTTLNAFQASGQNTTNGPIRITKMYLRSDITNATLPVLIRVTQAELIPGRTELLEPQNTLGVPAHANLAVVSANINTLYPDQPIQVPVEIFLRDFSDFTFVVEYEGGRYERHFRADEVKKQIAQFEMKALNETTRGTIPRVTKKPATQQ